LDGINSSDTSKVAILFNSEATPVGIREIDEKTGEVLSDYTYIVMPIKN
jgi:DNA polymerase III sliding clamp (beta) subunit (PCNA family)